MNKVRIHRKFKELYKLKTRYCMLTGGRSSLKSSTAADWMVRETYKEGFGCLAARQTMVSIKGSFFAGVQFAIEQLGVEKDFVLLDRDLINVHTGSFIRFVGFQTNRLSATANLKSLVGINTLVVEEAEELVNEAAFNKVDRSIRGKHKVPLRVVFVLNPTTRLHWLYRRFVEKEHRIDENGVEISTHPMMTHIHTDYQVCDELGYLDEDFKLIAEELKERDEEAYRNIYLGAWLDVAEGAIFSNWTRQEKFPNLEYIIGLDFGSNDPNAAVKVAIKDQTLYVEEMYYKRGEGLLALKAGLLKSKVRIGDIIIADNQAKSTIITLKKLGFKRLRPCVKTPIVDGIEHIKSFKLVVCGESKNLRMELANYIWADGKNDKAVDKFNHLLDAVRYAVNFIRPLKMGKLRKVEIERTGYTPRGDIYR